MKIMYSANFNSCEIDEVQVIGETPETVVYKDPWFSDPIKRDKKTLYSIITNTREEARTHLIQDACKNIDLAKARLERASEYLDRAENIVP